MKQVIVFAGTTEGREISEWLAEAGVETLCSGRQKSPASPWTAARA